MTSLPLHRDAAHRLDRALTFGPKAWAELQCLATLAREHTPDNDGYGHGRSATTGTIGRDISDTTGETATNLAHHGTDSSTAALTRAIHEVHIAAKHLAFALNGLRAYLHPVAPPEQGRVNETVICPACGELALPRVVSGYCPACYQDWYRQGMGDRVQFERERRTREQRAEGAA